MRKWFAIFLVLLISPLQSLAEMAIAYDEQGNFCSYYTGDYGTICDITPTTYPYAFPYESSEISIASVGFFQAKIGHGYYPFFHIRLDVSQLSDDEIYWLRKEDISADVFYASGNASADYGIFSTLINILWTDIKQIDFVFFDDTVYREPFDDVRLLPSITIKHRNKVNISLDSKDVAIDELYLHLGEIVSTPADLLTMEPIVLNKVKEKLAEKGLSIE